MAEWWNGIHGRLKICCLRACGFESHLGYQMKHLLWICLLAPTLCYGGAARSAFTVTVTVVASPSSGKATFETYCVKCHTFNELQNTTEQQIKEVISREGHQMVLTNKQIQDLASYLQTYY